MLLLVLTTTAYAPLSFLTGWLHDGREVQPRDPDPRGGAAGLHRQRHLERHLAGAPLPRRAPCPAQRARPARDAPHGRLTGDELAGSSAPPWSGTGPRASGTASASPTPVRARRATRGSGTGTRASPRSPGGGSTARGRAPSSRACSQPRTPDGFIGHTIFWEHPVSLSRRVYYNVASRSAAMTSTIQPPLLAWAWRIAVGDPGEEPGIRRHHEWLASQPRSRGRRPPVDRAAGRVGPRRLAEVRPGLGLVGARAPRVSRADPPQPAPRLGRPAQSATRAARCSARSTTNVLWGLARLAAGEPSITPALVDRLWDEERGLFLDEAQPGGQRPAVETWAALAPLALPDLPEAIGRRLVDEHLLDPDRFWLPVPPPSVSAAETTFVRPTRRARSAATGAARLG